MVRVNGSREENVRLERNMSRNGDLESHSGT